MLLVFLLAPTNATKDTYLLLLAFHPRVCKGGKACCGCSLGLGLRLGHVLVGSNVFFFCLSCSIASRRSRTCPPTQGNIVAPSLVQQRWQDHKVDLPVSLLHCWVSHSRSDMAHEKALLASLVFPLTWSGM